MLTRHRHIGALVLVAVPIISGVVALALSTACARQEPEVEVRTVEVDRVVTVEVPVLQTVVEREEVVVVETVDVERVVEVPVVQTVVIDVPVVETVEVQKIVEVPVPQTVEVPREVIVEVPVLQTVVVEKIVEISVPQTVEVLREVTVEVPVLQTVVVEWVVEVPTPSAPEGLEVTPFVGYPDVPRNRTLVFTHWGDSYRTEHDNVENFNWWLPGNSHARHASEKGLIEYLFYTNLNNGEIIPWLGETFEYNDSLDAIDVKIREGVKWSDGIPFTAHDVKFTIDMVRGNATDLAGSTLWRDKIDNVEVHDDYNLTIHLSRPDPRFFQEEFGFGWENHNPIVPKHVWENQDPLTFTNYDPKKGWPLGTGAYRLALSTPEMQLYDRRDDWWASEIGFHDSPKVERLKYIPVASEEMALQLYVNNELDAGPSLRRQTFEDLTDFYEQVRSWHLEAPVWGAPTGCNYVLVLNNQKKHFRSVDVRWAINHAIDRSEIVQIGYEGSIPPLVVPISSYAAKQYLPLMQDIIDRYNPDDPDAEKVEVRMTSAGYWMDTEGFWTRDGERVEITLEIPSWIRPQGLLLEKQLRSAGFEATFKKTEPATIGDRLRLGETEVVWVQCGSYLDLYPTFKSYHSKNSARPGEVNFGLSQGGRYENPEMDALLDEMEAMLHSPDDPRYVELARQAMELFLRDMPVIHIAEELHVIVHNTHYWQGWPGVEDPYVAPYPPWNGWYQIEPTGN